MLTQKFKGDSLELQMETVGASATDFVSAALDQFEAGGFSASDFLLMLYDEGRMPFSNRIPRESFVSFYREALLNFPVTGTFDAYQFILKKVFGDSTEVLFEVPAAGKLEILVNAGSEVEFDAFVTLLQSGAFVDYDLVDSLGNNIVFRGISGIDTEYKLQLLLSELIPAGVFTTFTLSFFRLYVFEGLDGSGAFDVLDSNGDNIVFFEIGA